MTATNKINSLLSETWCNAIVENIEHNVEIEALFAFELGLATLQENIWFNIKRNILMRLSEEHK